MAPIEKEDYEGLWEHFVPGSAPGDGACCRLRASVLNSDMVCTMREGIEHSREAGIDCEVFCHACSGQLFFDLGSAEAEKQRDLIAALRELVAGRGGSLLVEAAPPEVKRDIDVWAGNMATLALMRRLKRACDPDDVLSPGRFFGGI